MTVERIAEKFELAKHYKSLTLTVPLDELQGLLSDYAALKAECDELKGQVVSLAVENEAMKADYRIIPALKRMGYPKPTPATDYAIANWQAQGVEKLATFAGEEYQRSAGDKTLQRKWKGIVLLCTDFARQLRKGVGK